jgi:protease II
MRSQKLILKAMITSPNKCFILQKMEQNPMIITYKKRITIKWTNPTMLYGYGGFNVSLTQVLVLLMPFG